MSSISMVGRTAAGSADTVTTTVRGGADPGTRRFPRLLGVVAIWRDSKNEEGAFTFRPEAESRWPCC